MQMGRCTWLLHWLVVHFLTSAKELRKALPGYIMRWKVRWLGSQVFTRVFSVDIAIRVEISGVLRLLTI